MRSPVETTHRVRGPLMRWFELFFFVTLFALAVATGPRPLNTVRLYIAAYCHRVFAVEELFFAPAVIDEFQLVTNEGRKKLKECRGRANRFCASYSCTLRPCRRPPTSVIWCTGLGHFHFRCIDDGFEAWTCRRWYWRTPSFILMRLWWIFIGHCWSYLKTICEMGVELSRWKDRIEKEITKSIFVYIGFLWLHVWHFSTVKVPSDYCHNSSLDIYVDSIKK